MVISPEKDKFIINKDKTLNAALSLLNKNIFKCLIVLDNKKKLVGTLTDGDIRRLLLNGANFDDKVLKFVNKKPFILKYKKKQRFEISNKHKNQYEIIPVVDNHNILKNIITSSDSHSFKNFFVKKSIKVRNIQTVIMAGGLGKRLLPQTNVIPKPLLPINGKSMIEHVIDTFASYNLENFYISINYKGNLIRTYLNELKKKCKIKFIQEKIPMGTVGSLNLIKNKIKKSFFLINCDSFTICNYISLFHFHEENNFLLTVVVSKKKQQIPYGVCKINQKGQLLNLNEKPETTFLANTGLYVVNPKILSLIPKGKSFDMNELIEKLIKMKKKVGVFPIQESEWQDLSSLSLESSLI